VPGRPVFIGLNLQVRRRDESLRSEGFGGLFSRLAAWLTQRAEAASCFDPRRRWRVLTRGGSVSRVKDLDGWSRDRNLKEELDSVILMHMDEHLRASMNQEESRRRALIEVGGPEQVRQAVRDVGAFHPQSKPTGAFPICATFALDLLGGRQEARQNRCR